MADLFTTERSRAYEHDLAQALGMAHSISVSSGTAALHVALLAADIGGGDEVLVPALTVPMTIAAVHHAGAAPVFVDCDADGIGLDLDDAATKLTPRTRAVLPVHLWGRALDPGTLRTFAAAHRLLVIEDACQALGTYTGGQLAGTHGDISCFSTKDGKLIWSGEGGFLVTNDDALAAEARALTNHYLTPPDGLAPLTRIGFNYRLAEPLAAYAHANLARFDELLTHRRAQAALLARLLEDVDQLAPLPAPAGWNGYSALFRLRIEQPRAFCTLLASRGVPNSVGTFHLTAADQRPALVARPAPPCRRAAQTIDHTLAVVLHDALTDDHLRTQAATIAKEARAWTP
ncbi:DegT/DnrJ/EryC1/StrS family aminotransferase [Streptomyces sp. NPDC056486]|uniref:DegT/DnrJ/EryC1/StrS family aminotransferase n=1 Tax=Streptomyces sp. NPDC056486 TaxID=3345835 RepID=UPI003699FDCA